MTPGLSAALTGRYQVSRELGAGGMARVYLAHDAKHDREVAIKVLRDDLAASIGAERFLAEIKTTAKLNHPHILPLHDSGEANGYLYYVMPFVDGETLRERLTREGRMSVDDALSIAREVADALSYAHGHGVVHRDIKPENIFLAGGHALVSDFGIARAASVGTTRITSVGMALGTPAYMSPEQAVGEDVDGRADQYALASVLYEMLAGEAPFNGPTLESILVQRFTQAPPKVSVKRPEVPRSVESAVSTAMARSPAERFPTMSMFVESLSMHSATPPARPKARSIAVLPFANMSGDAQNEYFSDGISEEIINALAQLPGLHVAARTSAFSFKGRNVDLRTIGDQLGVATVLEGSVRKAGNRLRITAQLIDVSDGYHLWSERYDRELTDVFVVQDEIASAIAAKLDVTFGSRGDAQLVKPPTEDVDAYDAYLKGRALMQKRGASLSLAVEVFEHAIAIDPRFAAAHAYLGESLVLMSMWGIVPFGDLRARATAAIETAVALEPDSVSSQIALGLLRFASFDRGRASEAWTRAVELDPSDADARAIYALYDGAYLRGDFDTAILEVERAVAADPRSAAIRTHQSLVLAWANRTSDAERAAREAVALEPDAFYARWGLVHVLARSGNGAAAIRAAHEVMAKFGRHSWIVTAQALGARHVRPDTATALFDELSARAKTTYVQPVMLATAALAAGRSDDAVRLLNEAIDDSDPLLALVLGHWPAFDELRGRADFRAILRRLGWEQPLAAGRRPPPPPASL
jgi:serine/threonine-protein kinase